MNTKDYRTRTYFEERNNPNFNENIFPMAIDIGYSAVKGMAQGVCFSFPSYARKISSSPMLGEPSEDEIIYIDNKTNEKWLVGYKAQTMISLEDSNDSELSLYGRNRYFSEMFLVIARAGMGIALTKNKFANPEGKELFLMTGLPPKYLKSDSPLLREALSGHHSFSLKIGNHESKIFDFELPEKNIKIMSQPNGSLISVSTANNGRMTQDANKYLTSKMLVFDSGFGTADCFVIHNRTVDETASQTFDFLGMKRVLQETANEIFEKYHVEIPVPAMQPYLETGTIKQFNRKEHKSTYVPFDDILEKCSKKVCFEALDKLSEIYNYFIDFDYFVITGGTGAAWKNYIKEYLQDMDTLTILSGSQNDDLPDIFSNVRGYYMFLVQLIKNI